MNNLRELINAVLEGKVIQFQLAETALPQDWTDYPNCTRAEVIRHICDETTRYVFKIKPEKKVVQYRNCLWSNDTIGMWHSGDAVQQGFYERCRGFVKWIGDTQEYEIEE